jgi:hypothetical protein
MPLLNPLSGRQIAEVLKEASPVNEKPDLETLLRNNNLTADEVLDNLAGLMRGAENEATRLRACEMGVKLNGLITGDEGNKIPSITIIIKDPAAAEISVNPILIPREMNA